jgi:hypothetical protein
MVPAGWENPRVVIDPPATVKACVMPPVTNGHSSSVNPMNELPSQARNWTIRIVAPWGRRSRSRRAVSAAAPIATMNAQNARPTIRSVHRVTPLPRRGTMSAPMTFVQATITSAPPATAANDRTATGTTIRALLSGP